MKPFEHTYARDLDHAAEMLRTHRGRAAVIAGGSDLLAMMKENLSAPDLVINLQRIEGINSIEFDDRYGLNIGGMTKLRDLETNVILNERCAVLAKAAAAVASPQIRNVATVGGNLAQRTRCWYYRGPFKCWLKDGTECYAVEGENQYHAVFGKGPCYMVQASDLATALYALDGRIGIVGSRGSRTVTASEFFVNPTEDNRRENILEADEIITNVIIPPLPPSARSGFIKATQRAAWDAALVSIAYLIVEDGEVCRQAKIALGGVATTPIRAHAAEHELIGNVLSPAVIARAAAAIVDGSHVLSQNAYKIPLLQGCFQSVFAG
jgi:xanthine dehydrogenase YagS FAD-binding subunit